MAIIAVLCASVALTGAWSAKKYITVSKKHAEYIKTTPDPKADRPILYDIKRNQLLYILTEKDVNALVASYKKDRKFALDKEVLDSLSPKEKSDLAYILKSLSENFAAQYAADEEIIRKKSSLSNFAQAEYPTYKRDVVIALLMLLLPTMLTVVGFWVVGTLKRRKPVAKKK